LGERWQSLPSQLSGGQQQRVAIARALVHSPRLIVCDEPTSALDPEAAVLVRDFIEELKEQGKTIFLCTHNLDEAERLCQRVAIFKTSLISVDTPDRLRETLFGRKVVFHLTAVKPDWVALVKNFDFVKDTQVVDNRLVVSLSDPEQQNPLLVRSLVEAGAQVQFVGELHHSLEDIYLQVIHSNAGEGK
jgi:ABC-2 type transport system ATP-binding protein